MSENIMYKYSNIIDDIAQNVHDNMKNGDYEDETEAINDELDRSLIYYEDQAIILGAMLIKGVIKMGENIEWSEIWEEVYDDIYGELGNIKEKENE